MRGSPGRSCYFVSSYGLAFIQHGSGKLMHPSEFAAEFGIPVWLALATMLTQLIGGILLILER